MGVGSDHSLIKEIALLANLATSVLYLIGFVTTSWALPVDQSQDKLVSGVGLWKYCQNVYDGSECHDLVPRPLKSWMRATQAMVTMGFILMVVDFCMIGVSEFIKKFRTDPKLVLVFVITNFVATFFASAGIMIFAMEVEGHVIVDEEGDNLYLKVGWSFILAAVATGLHPIAGILGVVELLFSDKVYPLFGDKNPNNLAPGIDNPNSIIEMDTVQRDGASSSAGVPNGVQGGPGEVTQGETIPGEAFQGEGAPGETKAEEASPVDNSSQAATIEEPPPEVNLMEL